MNYKFLIPTVPDVDCCMDCWKRVYNNQHFTNHGPVEKEFENQLANYLDVKYCVAISSGTTALMIAIKALNIKGKILVPSFTFAATASSAIWLGLNIGFVDINQNSFCMCCEDLENKIDETVEAVIPVATFGNPCNIDEIEFICKKHNLKLIFDSAGALGATYKNKKIGGFGDCECFSLHTTKIVTSIEGGIISTNNTELYEKINHMRNFGIIGFGKLNDVGINGKMSEIHACVGIQSLKNIDEKLNHRLNLVNKYKQNLSCLPVRFQDNQGSSNQLFPILVDDRDGLKKHLENFGIETRIYYNPLLNESVYNCQDLTINAKKIFDKIICLPLYEQLTFEDIDEMCEKIKLYF